MRSDRNVRMERQHIIKSNVVIGEIREKEEINDLMVFIKEKLDSPWCHNMINIRADIQRIVRTNDGQNQLVHDVLDPFDGGGRRGWGKQGVDCCFHLGMNDLSLVDMILIGV